jgi:hypothetical protein
MPDGLDVARYGVDAMVLGIGLVDAKDRVSHYSPEVSRATATPPRAARNGLVSLTLKCKSTTATPPKPCSMDAPPQIKSQTIPSGYRGTLKTIEHIRDLIKRGAKDFHVTTLFLYLSCT